jgi:hypothetical protein
MATRNLRCCAATSNPLTLQFFTYFAILRFWPASLGPILADWKIGQITASFLHGTVSEFRNRSQEMISYFSWSPKGENRILPAR